jgi:hypothetical protein
MVPSAAIWQLLAAAERNFRQWVISHEAKEDITAAEAAEMEEEHFYETLFTSLLSHSILVFLHLGRQHQS